MYTSVANETVQYYLHKKSSVYACELDASKAFDKVNFGKLFKLLVDRKNPTIVIRLLLDNYTRQYICTTWNVTKIFLHLLHQMVYVKVVFYRHSYSMYILMR